MCRGREKIKVKEFKDPGEWNWGDLRGGDEDLRMQRMEMELIEGGLKTKAPHLKLPI